VEVRIRKDSQTRGSYKKVNRADRKVSEELEGLPGGRP
jgi:hypothetical protein